MNRDRSLYFILVALAVLSGIIMGLNTHELSKKDEGDKADIATSVINLSVSGVIFLLGFYLIVYMSGGYMAVKDATVVSVKNAMNEMPKYTDDITASVSVAPPVHDQMSGLPATFDQATLDALS